MVHNKNNKSPSIDNPTPEMLEFALQTFPTEVPHSVDAHITLYAHPPCDIKLPRDNTTFNVYKNFLTECSVRNFHPTQLNVDYHFRTQTFRVTNIEHLINFESVVNLKSVDLLSCLLPLFEKSGIPFAMKINMGGYNVEETPFNLKELTGFRKEVNNHPYIGRVYLPLNSASFGDDPAQHPGSTLEFYGDSLMMRNDFGQFPISKQAREYFNSIIQKCKEEDDPLPF